MGMLARATCLMLSSSLELFNRALHIGDNKKLASSTAFFSQLQDEVQTNVRAKKAAKEKKKKPVVDASKLML
ncbi:hypothetical protein PoB_001864500 [Plakobranchus ocellatus]|uniref:Uncharacterized protein n=1 Tax=Plakobranchus ocellatus TaxID=259542 RepID=A0AAV3ZC54_9GAST|nr:hypothetical protein PoB_001864500 [Plakobranchus ocellatus]